VAEQELMDLLKMEFMECESCSTKTGSPVLCPSCLQNRKQTDALKEYIRKHTDLNHE